MASRNFEITSDLAAIESASRAIVYLTVDWSGPERRAREVVNAAVSLLSDVQFEFFVVEGDGLATAWLVSHGWSKEPRGYGSVLWFEFGRKVATELLPGDAGIECISRKTREMWSERS